MNTRKSVGALGLVAGVLIALILAVYTASSRTNNQLTTTGSSQSVIIAPGESSSTVTSIESATLQKVEADGPIIALAQARQSVSLNFTLPPAPLPDGLVLSEIRGFPNHVALVYSSSEFPALPNFDKGNMLISIARDNTTYVPASGYSSGYSALISCDNSVKPPACTTISQSSASMRQTTIMNVTVSGHPGISFYPVGPQGLGGLSWWSNGVHYTISAVLPLTELMKIAESMKT